MVNGLKSVSHRVHTLWLSRVPWIFHYLDQLDLHITSPRWRHRALMVTLTLMESCVAAALFIPLNPSTARHSPAVALLGFAGLIALAYWVTRLMPRTNFTLEQQRWLLVGCVLVSTLLLTRFHVYARFPLSSWEWVSRMLREWSSLSPEMSDAPITLSVMLFCWWRGIRLNYRELTLQSVSLSFRVNVLWLVVAGVLWTPSRSAGIALLVFLYFFFALVAMALARVDEIAGHKGGTNQPFGLGWLSIVLGSAGVVIGLGWVFTRFYSPDGFRQLGHWLAPVSRVIGDVLYIVLLALGSLLEPLFRFLLELIEQLIVLVQERLSWLQILAAPEARPTPSPAEVTQSTFPWDEVFRWSTIVGVIAVALIAIAFMLRKLRPPEDVAKVGDAWRGTLPASEWKNDLLANLRAGVERLVESLNLLGRYGLSMELYAALSIRSMYAHLCRLAAARGYPRQAATTPYEYLPILPHAFAGVDAELRRITEAYVGVHYGEIPSTLAELEEIRRCWERVRSSEKPPESS